MMIKKYLNTISVVTLLFFMNSFVIKADQIWHGVHTKSNYDKNSNKLVSTFWSTENPEFIIQNIIDFNEDKATKKSVYGLTVSKRAMTKYNANLIKDGEGGDYWYRVSPAQADDIIDIAAENANIDIDRGLLSAVYARDFYTVTGRGGILARGNNSYGAVVRRGATTVYQDYIEGEVALVEEIEDLQNVEKVLDFEYVDMDMYFDSQLVSTRAMNEAEIGPDALADACIGRKILTASGKAAGPIMLALIAGAAYMEVVGIFAVIPKLDQMVFKVKNESRIPIAVQNYSDEAGFFETNYEKKDSYYTIEPGTSVNLRVGFVAPHGDDINYNMIFSELNLTDKYNKNNVKVYFTGSDTVWSLHAGNEFELRDQFGDLNNVSVYVAGNSWDNGDDTTITIKDKEVGL